MTPCFSGACTMPATFADDVAACAAAGFPALEVWLTKLETHLETATAAETRALLAQSGVRLAAGAYQGGLLLSQGEARRAHFDHFRRRLELCEALAIPVVLLAPDFRQKVQPQDLQRAVVSLTQAAQWAAGFGVRLALEFRAGDAFCTNLETAVQLVAACGEPNVGVNLDVVHFHTGPSKFDDLELLTADNLAFVQVADLAAVPRELATDADRILPGDGDLPLEKLVAHLRARGYRGDVSVELMNPTLWQIKPSHLAQLCLAAIKRLLDPSL
jgi:sugar phosphate isomerase/epimerase